MVNSFNKCLGTIISAVFASSVLLYSPCCASTVSLSWDANSEPTLAGYRVYYKADSSTLPFDGTAAVEGTSPVNVHNQTTATISGLDPNKTYFFAVTAYDSSGLESSYSNIVSVLEVVPPTTAVTAPANSATVSGTVSISASAGDNVGVTRVEFYANGVLQATDTASPYVHSWNTSSLAAGAYTLMTKAYDAAGNIGQSNSVTVTVVKDTTAPVVSLTAPSNNSSVSGTVAVTASASDNVGVSAVEFYINNALISAGNVAPYTFSWNTTAFVNGSYTLMARAYDIAGNIRQSANVAVAVNNVLSDTTNYTVSDALLALQIGSGQVTPTAMQVTRLDVAPVVNGISVPNGVVNTGDAIVLLSKIVDTAAM